MTQEQPNNALYLQRLSEVKTLLNKALPGGFSIKNLPLGQGADANTVDVVHFDYGNYSGRGLHKENYDTNGRVPFALVVVPFYNKYEAMLEGDEKKAFRDIFENYTHKNLPSIYGVGPEYTNDKKLKCVYLPSEGLAGYDSRGMFAIAPELLTNEKSYSAFTKVLENFVTFMDLYELGKASKSFSNVELPLESNLEDRSYIRGSEKHARYGGSLPYVNNTDKFGIIIDEPNRFSYNRPYKGPEKNSLEKFDSDSDKASRFYDAASRGIADLFKEYGVTKKDVLIAPDHNLVGHDFAKYGTTIRFDVKYFNDPEFAQKLPDMLKQVNAAVNVAVKDAESNFARLSRPARALNDNENWKLFSKSDPDFNTKGQPTVHYNSNVDLVGKISFIKTALTMQIESFYGKNSPEALKLEKRDLSKHIKVTPNEGEKNGGRITFTKEFASGFSKIDFKQVSDALAQEAINSLNPQSRTKG